MRKLQIVLALVILVATAAPVGAQNAELAANCSTFARNQAETSAPAAGGLLGGAARGATRGALFGAIVGGKKGAKRGAGLGGAVGGVRGGVKSRQGREADYRYYYDQCMRGGT